MFKELVFGLLIFGVLPVATFIGAAYLLDLRLNRFYNKGVCKKCGGKQLYLIYSMGVFVRCSKCGNNS